jgi:hypothetical protein
MSLGRTWITPPILGRISIGKVVEKNGKRLPEKDDQFTITSQLQSRDDWLPIFTLFKASLTQSKAHYLKNLKI